MARKRYRVVLEVLSNMDGDPPDGEEEKLIKSYLEGVNGVGIIEVREIGLAPAEPPFPLPSWVPDEQPTKTRKKKR